jgi:hypothetical protein
VSILVKKDQTFEGNMLERKSALCEIPEEQIMCLTISTYSRLPISGGSLKAPYRSNVNQVHSNPNFTFIPLLKDISSLHNKTCMYPV